MLRTPLSCAVVAALTCGLLAGPAAAQRGRWDDGRSGGYDRMGGPRSSGRADAAIEGRVDVATFRADGQAAAALRSGTIAVVPMPDGSGGADHRQDATFQAAVNNALLHAGYTDAGAAPSGQVAEVRIARSELRPAEAKRNPVSGETSVGMSNRGSMMGMGLYIDATKPKKALLSTMLQARIRDRASGTVLWEGRASIATRDGDSRWTDDAIAQRLASALFDGFPLRTGESSQRR